MKKHGICIALLYCVFIGACGDIDGRDSSDIGRPEGIIPSGVTSEVTSPITPTETIKAEMTETPSKSSEEITTVVTITPTEKENQVVEVVVATPSVTEGTVMPTLSPAPIVTEEPLMVLPSPTALPEIFNPKELGMDSYEDESGRQVYEASTFFYDENGLLCVGLKAVCAKDTESYTVEKCYYLPNGTVYREAAAVTERELLTLLEGNITKETHVTKAYEPIVFETVSNHVWTTDGQLTAASTLLGDSYKAKYSCTPKDGYIPVEEGEKFRVTFYFAATQKIAGILFLDDKDRVIESLSFNSTTQISNQLISVPRGAKKMHLSLFSNQEYRVEKRIDLVGIELDTITEEAYIEESLKGMLLISKKSMSGYSLDKAYITFVLDDCRPDMEKVVDIFGEYKVPLCIAAIHENLLYGCSNGEETRKDVCERVVACGGEILSHDTEVITEDSVSDFNNLVTEFFENKWILQQMGFDVNGIILAGGSGQLVGHPVTDVFARAFYEYSDLYGEQEYGEPYYHRRYWLGNCLDTYEDVINDAVTEKKWIILYLHDLNEVNAEKLREILQYVTSLEEEDAEIVTYKTLYDMMW